LGTSIANVALPTFVHALDASFQAVQWIVRWPTCWPSPPSS